MTTDDKPFLRRLGDETAFHGVEIEAFCAPCQAVIRDPGSMGTAEGSLCEECVAKVRREVATDDKPAPAGCQMWHQRTGTQCMRPAGHSGNHGVAEPGDGWEFGPGGASPEPAVKYDSEVRPMGGYFILAPNGSLTPVRISQRLREFVPMSVGPEEGAMDPAKPVAEPPYPFICTSVDDVAEAFGRSTGVPVAFVTDVPALRVALGAAPEMEALLRTDIATDLTADGVDHGECEDAFNDREETTTKAPAPWRSFCGDKCYACAARALLARLDAGQSTPEPPREQTNIVLSVMPNGNVKYSDCDDPRVSAMAMREEHAEPGALRTIVVAISRDGRPPDMVKAGDAVASVVDAVRAGT